MENQDLSDKRPLLQGEGEVHGMNPSERTSMVKGWRGREGDP